MKPALLLLCVSVCRAGVIDVSLNTSSLIGGDYALAFDLIDGDAAINNTLAIGGALFGGGSLTGSPILTGGASGNLASTVTILDTSFFNEYFHSFTAGSILSFQWSFTGNFAGGTPDSIAFLIIDNTTGLPVPTLDPLGTDLFLAIDLDSAAPVIQSFGTDESRTSISIAAPQVSPSDAVAPEPLTTLLVAAGLVCLVCMRKNTEGL